MISQEEALRLFAYDPDTGVVTRRITTSANAVAGQVVGSLDGKGYLHVSVAKRFYRLHRVIWLMVYGEMPVGAVDHEDRCRTNNRLSNLRPAGRRGNAGNTALAAHNASGFKGVSRNNGTGLWHAQIKINGKQTYLGRRGTPEEAAKLYDAAAKEHFGEFAWLNSDA